MKTILFPPRTTQVDLLRSRASLYLATLSQSVAQNRVGNVSLCFFSVGYRVKLGC